MRVNAASPGPTHTESSAPMGKDLDQPAADPDSNSAPLLGGPGNASLVSVTGAPMFPGPSLVASPQLVWP